MLKFEIVQCRHFLGGVVIVKIFAAVLAQQVIGSHSCCCFSDKFGDLGVLVCQNHNYKILVARAVSNTWKVPKGSRGVPPQRYFTSNDERDQFVTSKKMAKIVSQERWVRDSPTSARRFF